MLKSRLPLFHPIPLGDHLPHSHTGTDRSSANRRVTSNRSVTRYRYQPHLRPVLYAHRIESSRRPRLSPPPHVPSNATHARRFLCLRWSLLFLETISGDGACQGCACECDIPRGFRAVLNFVYPSRGRRGTRGTWIRVVTESRGQCPQSHAACCVLIDRASRASRPADCRYSPVRAEPIWKALPIPARRVPNHGATTGWTPAHDLNTVIRSVARSSFERQLCSRPERVVPT